MAGDGSQRPDELVHAVREGDILAGKYRVERVLGAGGMGVVVAAHHLQLDQRVAIKFLLPEGLQNPEAVARFDREARAAVKIKNEHVARMIDVGQLESGAPYIVMEYLEGHDLAHMLRTRGALPIEDAAEFVIQACEAIAEAHGFGIIHRDLKPANLFVVRRGDGVLAVKVLDFGISKITGLGSSGRDMGMTKTSAVMGSPLYMSPEQMESARNVDPRTDIWAVGVILYELVTGRPPFEAESMPELVVKIMTSPPIPLRNHRPDAPEAFEQVILRCLAKDRTKRFANVGELAVALVEFAPKRARASAERVSRTVQASGMSASALALPPSSDTTEPAPAGTGVSWGRSQTVNGRPRGKLIAFAIAGAAVLGIGAWFVRGLRSAEPAAIAPVPLAAMSQQVMTATAAPTALPSAVATASAEPTPPAPSASPPSAPEAKATPQRQKLSKSVALKPPDPVPVTPAPPPEPPVKKAAPPVPSPSPASTPRPSLEDLAKERR